MDFVSILDLKKVPEREGGRPAFFLDLNLNQVIDRICTLWERNVSSYYYYFPANRACEDYRREVFADIKQGDTYEILCRFSKQMQEWTRVRGNSEAVRSRQQREVWHIREVGCYCQAFLQLSRELEGLELQSAGMKGFRDYLKKYLATEEFRKLYETVQNLQAQLDSFRLQFVYENDRISVVTLSKEDKKNPKEPGKENTGICQGGQGSYDLFLKKSFPGKDRKMQNPFDVNMDLSELEQELLKIVQKQNAGLFKESGRFYKEFLNYTSEVLLRFVSEIEFYLSFYCFEKHMQDLDFEFSAAERVEQEQMKAYGLYDLALACTSRRKVVANDMSYLEGEKFFVLTGPNQGGKTTFARSLGQLVYFAKMGLDVPAKAAKVPYYGDILTHFSVEESVETGRGKLKEELVRLEPMMDATYENAFVIINELFTTAANYDACIMGKRVLKHFLEQKCQGIYVTHLKELAEEEPGIVSLRAMLDEKGKQSFEILRSPAVESANAINQVNKYRLTYEQLKERLV